MESMLYIVTLPILFFLLLVFLSIRLKFFSSGEIAGRLPFFFGSSLLLIALVWNIFTNQADYSNWFIPSAYSYIELIHFVIILLGSSLTVIGLVLFADYWQTQKREILQQEQKLSLLAELQQDAREPYHLMELFNLALKEIVSNVEETSGAIFLVNRSRRQLVLASSIGFSKTDTAHLEQYPLGQNLITQSIELGQPMISGLFRFENRNKQQVELGHESTLVLPLISGDEKIGAIVLLSAQKQHFSRAEIKFLSPIAEWFAEKIKSTKLTRELSQLTKEKEKLQESHSELNQRLFASSTALHSNEVIESYCRSLVGIAESKTVHLFGMHNGSLQFHGGSEPMLELSENYKTALIDALDKKKPLIINQESSAENGRTFIAKSSLIFPIVSTNSSDALLFVKNSKAFSVDDNELKTIEIFANLGRLSLQRKEIIELNITRRKGLDRVIGLLRFENSMTFSQNPNYFIEHLANTLPKKSIAITFEKQSNGSYVSQNGYQVDTEVLKQFDILPGESIVGNMNASLNSVYVFGKQNIDNTLNSFDEHNRALFIKLFGERGLPSFLAVCPIYNLHGVQGAVCFCMFAVSEEERGEWQKLLTLASGLYSIRLTINQLKAKTSEVIVGEKTVSEQIGNTVNVLNNHLSAIIGNAELIAVREDISGDIKNYFQSIVNESEQAAQFLRDSVGKFSGKIPKQFPEIKINDMIKEKMQAYHISDSMYQIGGSPREVNILLQDSSAIDLYQDKFKLLFEAVINRFAVTVTLDDIITIATYKKNNYLYLDISHHHKNFPPIQNVSDIGVYQSPEIVIENRPTERYLEFISGENCTFAYDKHSQIPTYLSFKFKIKDSNTSDLSGQTNTNKPIKILAIDDQTVILDLIVAMCQTLDYHVDIADSGEKGLEMALNNSYHLILTDLAMPGISGLDVARKIRNRYKEIPIILVTGWEVNLTEEQLTEAGISKVLYKPFRIEQLVEIMQNYVNPNSFSS